MKARYEVYAATEGRETLEGSLEDKAAAVSTAQLLLARTAEEVRVVEIKSGWTGRDYEKEVFAAKSDRKAEAPVNVPGSVDDVVLCREADDLYALPARAIAGQVARRYLDHHGLTVTEILHNARELRRIADADMLVVSAIGRIAARQVEVFGGAVDARIAELQTAFDAAVARARTHDVPTAVALDRDGLAAFLDRLPKAAGDPPRVYLARLGIARTLVITRSLPTKLELLLDWLAEPRPAAVSAEATRLIDGFLADVLVSGKVVQEALGARSNLAEALDALLDLAAGRLDTRRPGTEPQTVKLNAALGDHALPDSRAVLLDRVRRAVAGTQRLTKETAGPTGEEAAFKRLIGRIATPTGPSGGPDMAAALVHRYGRLRDKPAALAVPYAIRSIGHCFAGPWDEIVFLTNLLASPLGHEHEAAIVTALDGCLEESGSFDRILWTIGDGEERLRCIQAFHQLVAGLAIDHQHKVRIAQWIERGLVALTRRAAPEPAA